MAAYNSQHQYQHSVFPEDEGILNSNCFDDEPLRLSNFGEGGLALDDSIFDNFLCDSSNGNDTFERLFGDKPDEFDRMFLDESTLSTSGVAMKNMMDFDSMRFDSIQQEIPPSYDVNKTKRVNNGKIGRRRASQPASYKPEDMDVINFDPAPYIPSNNPTKVVSNAQPRRSSENDLAMFDDIHTSYSFTPPTTHSSYQAAAGTPVAVSHKVPKAGLRRRCTLDSTHHYTPSLAQLLGGDHTIGDAPQQECEHTFEYHEALQKLAESMKRTELSRRQLMMQRAIVSMGQQHHQHHQPQQPQHHQPVSPQPTHHQVQTQVANSSSVLLAPIL